LKVFISADIEGVTNITNWEETTLHHAAHAEARKQMTREVLAACSGARRAGATEIFVRDAHDSARNIIGDEMPDDVTLIRGWTGAPAAMMSGLDGSFDAVIFIGYHSGANYNGNPLSHTDNVMNNYVRINGKDAAEFDVNTYIAAYHKVPVVFVSGDEQLCEHAKELVSAIETVGVKKGVGGATFNMSTGKACALIEKGVEAGLKKLAECRIKEPDGYRVEICYKEPSSAYRACFYPGVSAVNSRTVSYTAKDAMEMETVNMFIL